ncbi:MAG: hypothetical protein J0649_01405 [Methylococcales bacterium]|jgi:hypothetical protein|nr:hypothetical protein [Methylococcales bacterium]
MKKLALIKTETGNTIQIGYDFESVLSELVYGDKVDFAIISTENGFSPLGRNIDFISAELNIDRQEITQIANWNRFENSKVSFVVLPSKNLSSKLRGVILAASGSSKCYEKYSSLSYSLPYRDFYYNVAYESISYAAQILGAQKISMSHLSASGQFHKDIATCVAEALAHFCDRIESPIIKQFLFFGCCMNESHFLGLERLNSEGKISKHHNITITTSLVDEFEVISLNW